MPTRPIVLVAVLAAALCGAPAALAGKAKGKPVDRDRDGIADRYERLVGMDATSRDSDGDGRPDGEEGAGRVLVNKKGRLVIRMFAGGVVRARLTDATEIFCPPSDDDLDALDAAEDEADPDVPVELDGDDGEDGEDPGDEPGADFREFGGDGLGDEPIDEEDEEELVDELEEELCDASELVPGTLVAASSSKAGGRTPAAKGKRATKARAAAKGKPGAKGKRAVKSRAGDRRWTAIELAP